MADHRSLIERVESRCAAPRPAPQAGAAARSSYAGDSAAGAFVNGSEPDRALLVALCLHVAVRILF